MNSAPLSSPFFVLLGPAMPEVLCFAKLERSVPCYKTTKIRSGEKRCAAMPRSSALSAVMAGHTPAQLARVRARRAPPAVRRVARAGWSRRWWGILAVAVQRADCSAVLGRWMSPPLAAGGGGPLLGDALWLAGPSAPSSPPSAGDGACRGPLFFVSLSHFAARLTRARRDGCLTA